MSVDDPDWLGTLKSSKREERKEMGYFEYKGWFGHLSADSNEGTSCSLQAYNKQGIASVHIWNMNTAGEVQAAKEFAAGVLQTLRETQRRKV